MNYLDIYTILLIIIGIIYLSFFVYSLKQKDNPLAVLFSLQCLFSAIYIFAVTAQLNAQSVEEIMFFQKIKYFGAPFIPLTWFLFSYRINKKRSPNIKLLLLLFIIPVLTLILVSTNEYHHLYYKSVSAIPYKGYLITHRETGVLYYLESVYSLGALVFSLYVFYKAWADSGYHLKSPYSGLSLGLISSSIICVLYLLGETPMGIDFMPLGFLIIAAGYALAIHYFDLFDTNEIYRDVIFSNLKEGIIVIDSNHILIDYNLAAKEVFTWLKEKNKGKKISTFSEGQLILESQNQDFSLALKRDDKIMYCDFKVTELKNNNITVGYTYVFMDTNEKHHMLKKLNYLARHDGLTDIYNKNTTLEVASSFLEDAKMSHDLVSVLIMDVDNFKYINDHYGHLAGDYVLKEIASELKIILSDKARFGRYGGDEFLIVLLGLSEKETLKLAERVREQISSKSYSIDNTNIQITLSIGIATIDFQTEDTDITLDQLIKYADIALYESKDSGRDSIQLYQEQFSK